MRFSRPRADDVRSYLQIAATCSSQVAALPQPISVVVAFPGNVLPRAPTRRNRRTVPDCLVLLARRIGIPFNDVALEADLLSLLNLQCCLVVEEAKHSSYQFVIPGTGWVIAFRNRSFCRHAELVQVPCGINCGSG